VSAPRSDCVVVGASFAGLACAFALARRGARVIVVEKKADPGSKLHTTGIIVKDAIDQIALLDTLPPTLTRRIPGVRLYSPNLRFVDLAAPGYYFLATDTPNVMRWLAQQAADAGAEIRCGCAYTAAGRVHGGLDLAGVGATRFVVGADGPRSLVARQFGLGTSRKHLFGVEYEYPLERAPQFAPDDRLHCFIDRRLAPGYIGWIVAGVSVLQVGLARRTGSATIAPDAAMNAFLRKIAPIVDLANSRPASVRAGLIPCGGVVRPAAARRVLLVGDAAGIVSPVTAGGIHTALKHGLAAGHAIADYLTGRCDDPSVWFTRSYPAYRLKRLLRFAYDRFQSDALFDLLLSTRAVRAAASIVYFHHKGVFDAEAERQRAFDWTEERSRSR
jgi:flavin-dependent dehydrogenase